MGFTSDLTAAAPAVRLTQHVKAGGCASKLAPGTLSHVLSRLPKQHDPNLLVGFETSDDAGIYRISPEQALVQTVDFFTPMVDDPFTYGRIAATNALSDIYAMGGRALTALTLVCFPQDGDMGVLEQILCGGLSVMEQAGCTVLGGHSVRDAEIKFGYAVTGLIHPDRILRNTTARPGDALIFTKALGTGVITTALKQDKAQPAWVELAFGSNVRLRIDTASIGLLDGAMEAVRLGCIPGGLLANRDFADCVIEETVAIEPNLRTLLFDPQTAGGLLLSVPTEQAQPLISELQAAGYPHTQQIGAVLEGPPKILLEL
jgi:selenide,water dikinase